ncbi:IS1096 element passenger TnpR family protein [Corynebacterium cystitidis]|uniref:IS1096 element passenger TnpR family protein n=1 Tax=Corynebacterium cystitidis TaxID=35757 RepID=UPI00358DC502
MKAQSKCKGKNTKKLKPCEVIALRISLDEATPQITRELHVHRDTLLPDLGNLLVYAMGWNNSHLHAFSTPGNTVFLAWPTSPRRRSWRLGMGLLTRM